MNKKELLYKYIYWELTINILMGIYLANSNVNIYFICAYFSVVDYLFARHSSSFLNRPSRLFALIAFYSALAIQCFVIPIFYMLLKDYIKDSYWDARVFIVFILFSIGYFYIQCLLKWGVLAFLTNSACLKSTEK